MRYDWIIQVEEDGYKRGVGIIHLILRGSAPSEVGLYLGEMSLWGHGVSKEALLRIINLVDSWGHERLQAVIHPDNIKSVKLFTSCGFSRMGISRRGQDLYELDVRTACRLKSSVFAPQRGDRLGYSESPG